MTRLYSQAAFTLDSRSIIEDDAPPAVGMDETGMADEFAAYSQEYREHLAGPLSLTCEDSGMTLTATVGGVDKDATRAVIDWGDGTADELDVGAPEGTLSATHVYRMAGHYTVVASAQTDQQTYEIAKQRVMGSSL